MEELKFKQVANHHLGCLVMHEGIIHSLRGLNIDTSESDEVVIAKLPLNEDSDYDPRVSFSEIKPILFPLSAMTDEQKEELFQVYQADDYPSDPTNETQAKATLYLLRNHFNVFNLPESEFIDCSKLENNPYLQS